MDEKVFTVTNAAAWDAALSDDLANYNKDISEFGGGPITDVNGTPCTVYRLREGIERFFITDINNPAASARAQSTISVFFDKVWPAAEAYNHIPGGGNILFMDGHVQFEKYPGEVWPVRKDAADVFIAIYGGG
jgi:prepilin-type processing-associated H-X9-DG protein